MAPAPAVAQIINALLGLIFFVLFVVLLLILNSFRTGTRKRQMGVFEPILQALEQIARGDFQVRFSPTLEANLVTSKLVKSVNQVAIELSQMEHLRQEFISNVSHEIQSPLTSIRGFAQVLRTQRLDQEDREHYLGIIETECTRLSRMTDNMLRLASLEAEQRRIEAKPYRLDKQIRALVLASEPQWSDKCIDIELSLDEIEILADEDLLSQVWNNLLHNSIKFTAEHGKIALDFHRSESQVECNITDTGIGISEEEQARIFERFYKADKSRVRTGGGSGLGLAIAKKIIELHQGVIKVSSQPGVGTSLTVVLPLA